MIYILEDDTSIRELEVYALESAGLKSRGFAEVEDFFNAVRGNAPALVILDLMLPGGADGLEGMKKLKECSPRTFVIIASAKGSEFDRVKGLDLGADDYLAKPFSMMEMVSRVKAVLRRSQPQQVSKLLKVGGLVVNLDEHTVIADGCRVQLTYKEFEILRMFLSHPGMVYTREQLFSQVWKQDYMGDSRTLDAHIRTLRQKLDGYGKMIETVRNVGYRWEAHYDK